MNIGPGITFGGGVVISGPPDFVKTNALLYLDAGQTASYAGSGTTWTDLSTNTNNATIAGSPPFTSSGSASYFTFTGSSSQYALTTSSKYNISLTGKSTFFAARMNSNFGTSLYRCLFGSYNNGTRNFNTYIYSPSSGVYQIHASLGSGSGLSNNLSLTTGQWFTCGMTQDGSGNLTFYFNGQAVGVTTGQTLAQYTTNSGESVAASDNYWYGDIALTAVYSRALSSTEMATNHAAIRNRYGI